MVMVVVMVTGRFQSCQVVVVLATLVLGFNATRRLDRVVLLAKAIFEIQANVTVAASDNTANR